jgi:hypothetical protein
MELAGCAIVSATKALAFDLNWSFEDVDAFLYGLLPRPFAFPASNVSRRSSKTAVEKVKATWVLLNKEQRRLLVVPGLTKPTGKDLEHYKGRDKALLKDSHIYIGKYRYCLTHQAHVDDYRNKALCKPVPDDIYQSWKPDKHDSTSDVDTAEGRGSELGESSASDTSSEMSNRSHGGGTTQSEFMVFLWYFYLNRR